MALQMASSSSSSSFSRPWTYDVFLSFRGEDTRNGFTAHLYDALHRKGINTCIDDELKRGEEISPALVHAIEGSRISIIVLSKNYASSTWCLAELTKILECKETRQQMVLPVFYKVDPSVVRKQSKNYGRALAELEDRLKDDMKLQRWKAALTEVANLSGFHLKKDGNESKFIGEIIQWLYSRIVNHTHLHVAKYPVGIESRLQDINSLLKVGMNDTRMIGIFGVGGIGKTTMAKAIYNLIAYQFEASCFLPNVRETSRQNRGIIQLQETLLFKILGNSSLKVDSDDQGVNVIKERLRCKRVFLVLDDVDHLKQLEELVGGHDWFGLGSRIIITTRDQSLLISHEVDFAYEVKRLDHKEALQLFSWNAFKTDQPIHEYGELAKHVVRYAGGIPLALKVLGSDLYGKSIEEWKSALNEYKRIPHEDIQKVLRISYEGLRENEKNIFLDIACFFKGEQIGYVIKIFDSCGFSPYIGIKKLMDKCLITIEKLNTLGMHDLVQEMGREIVREESPKEPGERSRLWFHEDIRYVLEENMGTNKVEGIVVDLPKGDDMIRLSPEAFMRMKNLRFFINRNAQFSGGLSYLPNELRVLDWPECSLQSLPSNFHGKKLIEFRMPNSLIKELGKGFESSHNLTTMDFSYCKFLTKIPDLSRSPNLKKLDLVLCTNLVEVHDSVGTLDKLVSLSLYGCSGLRSLPRSLKLRSLEWLNLYGCSSLGNFPEIHCEMKCLRQVGLEYTAIKELPLSIGYLTGLQALYLKGCKNLMLLPSTIFQLQHLELLHLNDCPNLIIFGKKVVENGQSIAHVMSVRKNEISSIALSARMGSSVSSYSSTAVPLYLDQASVLSESIFFTASNCFSSLAWLVLSGSNIVSLPENIKRFVALRRLYLKYCMQLQEIPELPPNIVEVHANGCKSLKSFPEVTKRLQFNTHCLQSLDFIDLSGCDKMLASIGNHVANPLMCKGRNNSDGIVFPGNRIPNWLSHCKEISQSNSCEIDISGLQHLDGIGGIVLCAVINGPIYSWYRCPTVCAQIIGNGVLRHIEDTFILFVNDDGLVLSSDHVWLGYSVIEQSELKGDNLRVEFFSKYHSVFFKSCGAHLVYKHEQRAKNYPGMLLEEVDVHLELPGEEIESSGEFMEGVDQLSKRYGDVDEGKMEWDLYTQKKRHSASTLGIQISS